MAVQKSIPFKQTSLILTYHRIDQIRHRAKQSMTVTLHSYEHEESRRSGEPFVDNVSATIPLVDRPMVKEEYTDIIDGQEVPQERMVPGDPVYIEDSIEPDNIVATAYRLVKTHEDWNDAKDIFEDGQE